MQNKITGIMLDIICGILLLIFVYAGLNKLWDHANFRTQLNLVVNNSIIANIVSYSIPFAELATALLLAVSQTRRTGLHIFLVMMLGFTIYISGMLLSGSNLPCTCGGFINSFSWQQHLVFNGCLIVITLYGIYLHKHIQQRLNRPAI